MAAEPEAALNQEAPGVAPRPPECSEADLLSPSDDLAVGPAALAGDAPALLLEGPASNAPVPDGLAGTPTIRDEPEPPAVPEIPPVRDVTDLDWIGLRASIDPLAIRARMRAAIEGMEALLDQAAGAGMLFDKDRADGNDRAIRLGASAVDSRPWIVGDLHGDLLALEAALALVARVATEEGGEPPRLIFLGDLFDDEGYGLEVLLRVFELIVAAPERVCVLAGNHDESLTYDGVRFGSGVAPSDFADLLNAHLAHEWIGRAGKLAVRLFDRAPRALFFPDGLLVSHGGFPLADLHARLAETGDWNDPACLSDFVWTRAHPTARRKLPNRYSRGSQFGREDFAEFCALATGLGRPIDRMVRGHDHVETRHAVYAIDRAHPVLTTVALSRRLGREAFGPYERVPTLARVAPGALPQVYRLHVPPDLVRELYPEAAASDMQERS